MARFGKRTVLLLLIAICLVSIAVRYPLVEHERHNDTFRMHQLANAIIEDDRAAWTFSPLSYFGYYPYSYPSATPFELAEVSSLTGLDVGTSILLVNMILGILFTFVVFGLSRHFVSRADLALLATLLATVAPRLVDTSNWNGSARVPFVILASFTILLALKAGQTHRKAMYGLFAPSIVVCFAFHHMAVLFALLGVAFLLSIFGAYAVTKAATVTSLRRSRGVFTGLFYVTLTAAIVFIVFFEMETLGNRIEETFQESWLFSFKPVVVSAVLNVAASFTNQIGFVFPFALVGVPFLLRKRRIAAELLFLAILLVVFIPMLPSSLYITMLLTPFVAILGVAWIGQLLHGKKHMFWLSVVVVIVIASILLPFWSSARWNETVQISGYTTVVDDQGVNDARYIGQYQDEAFAISNVDITGLRLSAISGTIFLGSGVMFVLSGDMTSEMVKENLTWAQEDFPNNLYSWFEAGNDATPDIRVLSLYQRGAYYSNLSEMRDFYSAHSRLLVTVDNNWPNNYVWVWGIYPASLPEELRSAIWHESDGSHPRFLPSYIVYESEGISMFATQLPVL